MADNVAITPGEGDTIAADDIGGAKYQRIKLAIGANGVNDGDVSSANPMPVTQSGAATSVKQDTGNTSLASIDSKITAVNTGAVVISSLPNEGQQTMANSISVAVASDQSAVPVDMSGASSATLSTVNDTASSTQLLASNATRKGASFYNTSTVDLYLKYGTTATTSSGGFTVIIPASEYFELPVPVYTGRIDGIWASDQSGAVSITEW